MSHAHRPEHLSLGTAQSLSVPARTVLRVERGRLWITMAGDLNDYFVHAGESLELPRGRVVIEADQGPSAVYVLVPQACGVPNAGYLIGSHEERALR